MCVCIYMFVCICIHVYYLDIIYYINIYIIYVNNFGAKADINEINKTLCLLPCPQTPNPHGRCGQTLGLEPNGKSLTVNT